MEKKENNIENNNNNNENNNNQNQQQEEPKIPVSSVVSKASYNYSTGFITNINEGLESSTLINNLTSKGATSVTVTNANGETKTGRLATGDKVTIKTNAGTETLEIVISGDTSGDGEITASDYVKIKNHIMGSQSLSGVFEKAADYNNDGSISASDYVKVKNHIMGG